MQIKRVELEAALVAWNDFVMLLKPFLIPNF
jgi:hypothetical protein